MTPLLLLAAAAAATALLLGLAERLVPVPVFVRSGFATLAVVALMAGGAGVWVNAGSPVHLADRAWSSFQAPPKKTGADVSERLFQFSNNGRLDLWQASYDTFRADPLLGTGAGTFWQVVGRQSESNRHEPGGPQPLRRDAG